MRNKTVIDIFARGLASVGITLALIVLLLIIVGGGI